MTWGSAIHHRRDLRPVEPKSRRMCRCGCRKRATHCGTANGVTLYMGCELSVRRWVRDGVNAFRPARRDQSTGGTSNE